MGGLNKAQFEKLAQGVADGQTKKAAAIAAGYAGQGTSYYQVAKRADFKARVEQLKQERRWGGSSDLGPVINMLLLGAEKAMGLDTAGGMNAAARMMSEAGRLKQKLPKTVRRSAVGAAETNIEAWLEKFGPKT